MPAAAACALIGLGLRFMGMLGLRDGLACGLHLPDIKV